MEKKRLIFIQQGCPHTPSQHALRLTSWNYLYRYLLFILYFSYFYQQNLEVQLVMSPLWNSMATKTLSYQVRAFHHIWFYGSRCVKNMQQQLLKRRWTSYLNNDIAILFLHFNTKEWDLPWKTAAYLPDEITVSHHKGGKSIFILRFDDVINACSTIITIMNYK